MTLEQLNKIRNFDFARGRTKPASWTWTQEGNGLAWEFAPSSEGEPVARMRLKSRSADCHGQWSQQFQCKAQQCYRVEAVVSCDCTSDKATGGLVVSLQPWDRDKKPGTPVTLAPVRQAQNFTIRAYYQTPPKTRRLRLGIGLRHTAGFATIHEVRVVPVMEPETKSYPLAIPAFPVAMPAPVRVATVRVVTEHVDRPIVGILRARFGDAAVTTCAPGRFPKRAPKADAIFILDEVPLAHCGSMGALERLATDRIVIVSLECAEAISRGRLATRLIRQVDDPLSARVVASNFVTQAMALRDIFPFGGRKSLSTEMFQRQFRTNKAFREYCNQHGFVPLLLAMTDSDATSEKPLALLRQTAGGAIIVMDVEPAEAIGSSLDEPTVAVGLILSALGARQHSLGRYAVPARTPRELAENLNDLVDRFPQLCRPPDCRHEAGERPQVITLGHSVSGHSVSGQSVSGQSVSGQSVSGQSAGSLGLPLVSRPVILIRSGLTGHDTVGICGTMMWTKQLVRPEPFLCPYVRTLASNYRVAWAPLCAPLQPWGGWHALDEPEPFPTEARFEPGSIACCIDVTTTRRHCVNVVTSCADAFHDRLAAVLPALSARVVSGRHFYHAVPTGIEAAERTSAHWRTDDLQANVIVRPGHFDTPLHQAAKAAGASLVRIEVPSTGTDPTSNSIWATDWVAMMLELTVGLLLGFVVVNRDPVPMRFDWPAALSKLRPDALMGKINEPSANVAPPARRGKSFVLPAGHAVVAVRHGR